MKKIVAIIIFPLIILCGLAIFNQNVQAKNIGYHTYKYGTRQTSMADGYYARPAQIEADRDHYLITMTIRTKASLSPYPVKVLSINGQRPINIEKKRHGSDYDYRYSFYATNLRKPISSQISINVPGVYKAKHNISFAFDTNNLPKLVKSNSKLVKKDASSTPAKHTDSDDGKNISAEIKQLKKKQRQLASQQLAQNQKNHQENINNQKMFYYVILGGFLSSIVLVVAAIFLVIGAKKQRKDK